MTDHSIIVTDYAREHRDELVSMWRRSFEKALELTDPHPLREQVAYFERVVLPNNRVRVALDAEGRVVGFLASTPETIAQLYVDVDAQGRGVGTALLERAKQESSGRLELYTFARNDNARRFYLKHGFTEISRGFEAEWQLEDVLLAWVRAPDE